MSRQKRSCGTCTECCEHLPFTFGMGAVHAKEPHVPCNLLRSDMTGCGAYETRPPFCRRYVCLWALGDKRLLDAAMRPDKSKVLVHEKTSPAGDRRLAITATGPGALESPDNKRAIRRFLGQRKWAGVVLVDYDNKETWRARIRTA